MKKIKRLVDGFVGEREKVNKLAMDLGTEWKRIQTGCPQ